MSHESVLTEAEHLVNGPRRDAYGGVEESFTMVAQGWASIIGSPVSASQVALCMVWLKVMREANKHQRDNLVDICGYTELAAQLEDSALVRLGLA